MRTFALFALAVLLPVALWGCGGGGGNATSPTGAEMSVATAHVVVAGEVVDGRTLPAGHGQGQSTRFEASVEMPFGAPPASQVWMHFDRPGEMGMGAGRSGTVALYDDGTHGDRVSGDGVYCLEDFVGDLGCHGADAPAGEYHYEFWGTHHGDRETNHLQVHVTLTRG